MAMKATPNVYIDNKDGTTTIRVSKMDGRTFDAVIDTVDVDLVNDRSWCVSSYGYLVSGKPTVFMHRILLGLESNEIGDHADGDRLNNRRSNLRKTTHRGNNQNCEMRNNGIGIKGVTIRHHKISGITYAAAQVRCPDGVRRIKQFSIQKFGLLEAVAAAAIAARDMREKFHGEFARHD